MNSPPATDCSSGRASAATKIDPVAMRLQPCQPCCWNAEPSVHSQVRAKDGHPHGIEGEAPV
jgi:hypothetical protein